jgi:thiazole/oxazole-forming peptide maturase SagD family component
MKTTLHPLCVVTAVPVETGIKFLHPKTQYEVDVYVDEIWAIIAESNGYQTRIDIVKKLKQFDPEVLEVIIDDLLEIGVLIDSRDYARHFHGFTTNPMYFSHNMSLADVVEYSKGPHLPVFDGTQFSFSNVPKTIVSEVSSDRETCRSFEKTQLNTSDVGAILKGSYAIDGKPTPSAGGLYPLKLYLIVVQEGSLPIGYYEYDAVNQSLILYKKGVDRENLEFAFNSDNLLYGAGQILVITADLGRHMGKYSGRGYRYTLLEAGHVAQNVQLISNELGIGCLEYGGFQDEVLADELGLAEAGISPLITIALGHKSEEIQYDSAAVLARLESSLVGRSKPVRYVQQTGGGKPENGESFFSTVALHKPSPQQDAHKSYSQRFVGGTGTSSVLASVKAIAEAYERHASGDIRIDVKSTASELTSRWIDPRIATPFSNEQFARLPQLNPFDENKEYEWTTGYSLINGETVLAPIDLVYYPVFKKSLGRKPIYQASSSGVAAHTTKGEAEKRALLEAIERDSLMRTWFSRTSAQKIAMNALPLHWQKRIEFWAERGYATYVFDIGRYGVSVVSVVMVSEESYPAFVQGASASLESFEQSLSKAFHEAELALLHLMKYPKARPLDPMKVLNPTGHALFYAHPDHLDNLRWLWGGEETSVVPEIATSLDELYVRLDPISFRLSPENAPLHVVRVISDRLVPINFGHSSEHYMHRALEEGAVHPDSIKFPHFFA